MLYVLVGLLSLLLFIIYRTYNKEICCPAFLFTLPFIIMCIVACIFKNTWNFELELNTFFIILFGNVFFFLGTYLGNKKKKINDSNKKKEKTENGIIKNNILKKNWIYIFMLIFQFVCYITKIKYIMEFGVAHGASNNLSKCLVYYNNVIKFTTKEAISFPGWLSIGLDICTVFGFLCAIELANKIIYKDKEKKSTKTILIIANFIMSIVGGLTSGGRGGAIQPLISLLCACIMLYQRKKTKKVISLKMILLTILSISGIIVFFVLSVAWVGRYEVHLVGQYLSNYIGAQIFNLNYAINNMNIEYSVIFGQETFFPIIQKISSIFSIDKWSNYYVGEKSINVVGYNTGNVFTCFYSYIKDLGFLGVIVFPIIFGFISQKIYNSAKNRKSNNLISFPFIVYCYYSYIIAFSFFADKFGSIFFTFNMVKRLIILYIMYFIFYRIELIDGKIIIKKEK